jgi:hypothetical protein
MNAVKVRELAPGKTLYRLSDKLSHKGTNTEYVLVSEATLFGPETLVFAADGDGNVTTWSEMIGERSVGVDHRTLLSRIDISL